jgi:YD repeat-containing protein
MAAIIGGPETGLLDSSFGKLNRDDATSKSDVGHGEEILVNVSNGNLLLTQQDAFLPSLGDDYQLVRTYNSRGRPSDASQHDDARWTSTTSIHLKQVNSGGEKRFEVEYGDGSFFEYRLDAKTGLYVSNDGAGAYETLRDLNAKGNATDYYEVTRADQTKLTFDKQGNLIRWEDPNGVGMVYTYKSNRLAKVEDDTGHVINYNYSKGILASITDENEGVLVEYHYSKQRLSEVVDREGHVTKYFYTNDGFVNRIVLPYEPGTPQSEQRQISFEYAKVNWSDGGTGPQLVLTKMTDAEGKVTTFDYNIQLGKGKSYDGGSTTVTDASGARLTYEYNAKGDITKVTDQGGKTTRYTYDDKGNVLTVNDRNNHTSTSTYDDRGNRLTSTDNSGNTTTYTYSAFNKIETITSPEGGVTTFEYDEDDTDADGKKTLNLLRQTDPGGDITDFEYDLLGNLTKSIVYLDSSDLAASEQQITQYFYDAYGNNIQVIDAQGNVTRSEYDHFGNLLRTVAFAGQPVSNEPDNLTPADPTKDQVTIYTYDNDNRLLTTTDPEGHITTNTYDAVGNRISFRDARGSVTTYIYDLNNRLIGTIDPASAPAEARETTRVYDVLGNQTKLTDAQGRTTTYSYNARRELLDVVTTSVTGVNGPTSYTTSYTYDGEGNQLTVNDNRGKVTTFTYTETGLLKSEENAAGQITQYNYDGNLNILSIAAGMQLPASKRQIVTFEYDEENQVIKVREKLSDGGDNTATGDEFNETEYSYDAPGTIATITDGNGNTTVFEYDLNNRLIREILPAVPGENGDPLNDTTWVNHEVLHTFDAFGNETEVVDANGGIVRLVFDRDNRNIRIEQANEGDTGNIVVTSFGYDANDNVTTIRIDGADTAVAQVSTYVYDKFDQLIAEIDGVGNALATSNDPLYKKIRLELGKEEDQGNLTPTDRAELRALYTTHYTYDRVGNQTSTADNEGRATGFEYDGLNRLVTRTDANSGTRQYLYDGNGNLLSLIDERGKETKYTYDDNNRLTVITNPLNELTGIDYDAFDNIVSTREARGSLVERTSTFEYDLRNLLVKELESNSRETTYDYDAVGNRIAVTDARNNKTEYIYDALNQNIEIIDRRDLSTKFVYDGLGNQLKIMDPRGGVTEFMYDPGSRLIGFVDAEGRETSYKYDALGNQILQTTAVGTGDSSIVGSLGAEVTTYKYDAQNNLREVINADGESATFNFDRVYNQTEVKDALGNITNTSFDALNRVVEIKNAENDTKTFTYDEVGNQLTQTDEKGRITQYDYDDNDQLLKVVGPDLVETHYQSDAFGAVISITRAANIVDLATTRRFEYDEHGNLVKEYDPTPGAPIGVFDPAGVAFKSYAYDANNNVIAQTDQRGNTTTYEYNANNEVTKILDPVAVNQATRGITEFKYDDSGNRNFVKDARGNESRFYYNANNELALAVDALGYATASSYDVNGNLIATTQYANAITVGTGDVIPILPTSSAQDQTTRLEYDALNQLVKRTDALGFTQEYKYDSVGNLKEIGQQTVKASAVFNTTRYDYDTLNRQTKVTDDYNKFEEYVYDKVGNKTSETDKNGNITTFSYDQYDRLLSVIDPGPAAGEQVFEYDEVGNLISENDQNGVFTYFEYDALNRVTKSTNNLGDSVTYEYDLVGNQTAVTDEKLNKTDYEYNALNRLIKVTDAEGGVENYFYNGVGNEQRRVEENGGLPFAETTFIYDQLNRLEKRQDAEASATERLVITYDGFGNQLTKTDESGVVTTYTYDRNNQLKTIVETGNTATTIEYDGAGNTISQTDPRGNKTTYEYDKLDRRTNTIDPFASSKTTTYDAVGNVVAFEDQRANSFYVEYDENNRRTAVLTKEGYLTTYEYDKAGNETVVKQYNQIYALQGGSILAPNGGDSPRVTAYFYNDLNQLESQLEPGGLETTYSYDKAGNLDEIMDSALPGNARERVAYNKKNQVVTREDANGIITNLVLDKRGNVLESTEAFGTIDERTTTFTYDKLNRLKTETNELGTTVHFEYDASDRLTTRTTDGESGVVATRVETFAYDANGRIELEVDGAGARTVYAYDAAGNVTTVTYAEGTGFAYSNHFVYDANNRLTSETDGEGIVTQYDYDERGNKIQTRQGVGSGDQPRITDYAYDDQDRLTSITNPRRDTTHYYYDAKGNQNIILDANGTVTVNTFDDAGRILTNTVGEGSVTTAVNGSATATIGSDFGGIKTTNTYDLLGNVLSTTVGYADGSDLRVTTYAYNDLNQLEKIIDPEGFSANFVYDVFGNQTRVTIGEYETAPGADTVKPQTTTFEYDAADQLIKTIDGNGNAIINAYDLHGNQISFITGVATPTSGDVEHLSTTTYRYDADGKLASKANTEGGRVELTRNVLGQETLSRTLQSSGVWVTERSEYDSFGRIAAEFDSSNVKTEYDYDAVGNLITLTRDAGGSDERITTLSYDANSNLVSQQDPEGGVTQFGYDALGNQVKITDDNGAKTHSYYDEYSRLIASVDAENYYTEFVRDVVGNVLTTRIYAQALVGSLGNTLPSAPTATPAEDRVVFQTFDKNGKRLTETAANGSVRYFEYDSVGLLRKQTETAATDTAARNRTVDLTDKLLSWNWDVAGRLIGFTNVDGVTETYTYDAAGNRLSETIHNPNSLATGGSELDSLTTFTYDFNNRVVSQSKGTFVERLTYDKAGNVLRKEDASGVGSTTTYDNNNRISSVTNALGQTISYGYDRVGNLTQVTDAKAYISNFVYDLNNRVVQERGALTDLYTLNPGGVVSSSSDRSEIVSQYDGVGNLVKSTDASGFSVVRWYDGRNQLVAEVDGDQVLRTYTYNAFGQAEQTLTDKVRVIGTPSAAGSPPVVSSSTVIITNEFDVMGNVIRTVLPSMTTTALTGSGAGIVAVDSSNQTMQDQVLFDAWGNPVESIDRMDNSSFSFVDLRGRQIASVDTEGFLITTSYDSQGNAVKQVKYETRLTGTVAGTSPPTTPPGNGYAVDKYYDAEGRLVREVSAPVGVYDYTGTVGASTVPVETRYTYNAAGNVTTKVLASGTAQAQTEYYFYNDLNQRTHVVSSNGVLATFVYDANGNLTEQRRYVNPVSVTSSSTPPIATGSSGDQIKRFAYNEVNLLESETTEMSSGDIVSVYGYDGSGNLIQKIEDFGGENITSLLGYDAAGRINLTISPNGGQSSVAYNVFGLKAQATTGGDPNAQAPGATVNSTTMTNGLDAALTVNWTLETGSGLTSWVAWDIGSKAGASAADLASSRPNQDLTGTSGYTFGSKASEDGSSASISLDGLAAGTTVYFRVMVRDSLGNVSWSQERSAVVPSYVSRAFIKQTGADEYQVVAQFNGPVTNPKLLGASEVAMSLVVGSSNRYAATLTSVANPTNYDVGFKWDYSGQTYTTSQEPLLVAPTDPRDGNDGWILWTLPSDDTALIGTEQLVVFEGVARPGGESVNAAIGNTLQQQLALGDTVTNYDVYYGNRVAEDHALTVAFADAQDLVIDNVVNHPTQNIGTDDDPVYQTTTSWDEQYVSDANDTIATTIEVALLTAEANRAGASMQLAYRGVPSSGAFNDPAFTVVNMARAGDQFAVPIELAAGSTVDIKVFYTKPDGTEVIVRLERISIPDEIDNGTKTSHSNTQPGSTAPGVSSSTASTRTESITGPLYTAAQSFEVLASEQDGSIGVSGGDRVFNAGRYSGPVDASPLIADITSIATSGVAGKSAPFSAQAYDQRPYYSEVVYNDLGIKIASNEDDGLWRAYGVDANGNVVSTRLLGDNRNATTGIDTYARFDSRNLEIETVGPTGAVTTTTYDYASRITSINDPGPGGARAYRYDGTGNLVGETDARGGTMAYYYDRLGNLVRTVDQASHVEVFRYAYTGINANRLTSTYFEGLGSTTTVSYGYDSFSRRISMAKGGEITAVTYDQSNRIKTVTDSGLTSSTSDNNTTEYWYDNRDNQVLVKDANGIFFGRAYNEMGLVTHEFANFTGELSGVESSVTSAVDAIAAMDRYIAGDAGIWINGALLASNLVVKETRYDIFSNKSLTIGAEGEQRAFTYGAFARLASSGDSNYQYDEYGNQTREYVSGSKDIRKLYNDAGRVTDIDDIGWGSNPDGSRVHTVYTYDIAGNRKTEVLTVDSTVERSQTYTYDNKNQLTGWVDSAVGGPGNRESYTYHADGNLASVVNLDGTASYSFDAANRVVDVSGGDRSTSFTYNSASRRVSEGTTTYAYYSNGWLKTATAGSDTYTWTYDDVGNQTTVSENTVLKKQNTTYDYAYRVTNSTSYEDGIQITTTAFSKSGQTASTVVNNDGEVYTYNYYYDGDDREVSVIGGGGEGAAGTSSSTYDRNGKLSAVSLGASDTAGTTTSKSFVYDSDGKIYRAVSNGTDGGTFNYLYANGNSAGEYKSTTKVAADADTTKLNQGNYSTLSQISAGLDDDLGAFPASSIIQHIVAAGDTLRSIAQQYYGSGDLWYVIADANGLTGQEILKAGSRLLVPNTVENAYHTAETNPLYKEGDIIGSNLPNLKSPPPPKEDECAKITAIILIVVVAIAAIALTVVTVGAAAPAAVLLVAGTSAGLAATIAVSVAVGVVVGAAIAFAASVITQGILVGFGLQKEFDWEAVAADTVAGAFGGAAAGLGGAVATARTVTTLLKVSNIVGQIALESFGELASQAIQNDGQISNPWLVVAAGAGGALGAVGDLGKRGVQLGGTAGTVIKKGSSLGSEAGSLTSRTLGSVDEVASVARAAGKGRFGVFKDVFFSQLNPKKFTQSVAKSGLDDLADGKKLIRTVETAKDGVRTVTFESVDILSVAGTSKTARLGKALKSAGQAVAAAPGKLAQSISSAGTNLGKLVDSAGTSLKKALTAAGESLSNVPGKLQQSLSSAGKAIKAAPGKLAQSFTELRRGGRVTALDLPGNVKTIRTFKTVGDVRVEKLEVVFRQSYLGTTRGARLADAASTLANATGKQLRAAGTAVKDAAAKVKQSIYEAYKSGRVTSFDDDFGFQGNIKQIRSFETAANGSRVEKLQVVFKQSYLGTSKAARFKNFVGTAKSALSEARSAFTTKVGEKWVNVKTKVGKAVTDNIKGLKNPLSAQGAKTYGSGSEVVFGQITDNFIRTDNEKQSFYSSGSANRPTGAATKFTFLLSSPAGKVAFAAIGRGGAYGYSDVADTVEAAGSTEVTVKKTFFDANAGTTYADTHARQHNYLALEWRAVAGNTTTSVLSPFAIDRAASVDTLVESNRMVSGQVWDFDQASFVSFAEGSVGGVGGNATRTPSSFG